VTTLSLDDGSGMDVDELETEEGTEEEDGGGSCGGTLGEADDDDDGIGW
jgi:hypothetical protein